MVILFYQINLSVKLINITDGFITLELCFSSEKITKQM